MNTFALNQTIIRLFIFLILSLNVGTVIANDDDIAKVVYHVDFSEPKRVSAMIQNIFNMSSGLPHAHVV